MFKMGTIDDELAKLPDSNLTPEDIAKYQAENTAPPVDNTVEIDNKRNEIIGKYRNRDKRISRYFNYYMVLGTAFIIGSAVFFNYKNNSGHYSKYPEVIEYLNMKETLSDLESTTITVPKLHYMPNDIKEDLKIIYEDNVGVRNEALTRTRQKIRHDIEVKEKEDVVAKYINEINGQNKRLSKHLLIGASVIFGGLIIATLQTANNINRNKKLRKLEELTQQ